VVDATVVERLPETAIKVGCDTGVRNIAGLAPDEKDGRKPFTISAGYYYWETGISRRQKQMRKWVKKEKLASEDFAAAFVAVNAATKKTVDLAKLVSAAQVRGRSFRTMYAFYGSERFSAVRFHNYQGRQRVMDKLVRGVLPTKNHVLIAGDADFPSTIRGHRSGVATLFLKKCQELRKVIFVDEHRTSMLDSNTHTQMYNPPKKFAISKTGKRYLQRINGLYQSSAPSKFRISTDYPHHRLANSGKHIPY
jgi:hypothetical protein